MTKKTNFVQKESSVVNHGDDNWDDEVTWVEGQARLPGGLRFHASQRQQFRTIRRHGAYFVSQLCRQQLALKAQDQDISPHTLDSVSLKDEWHRLCCQPCRTVLSHHTSCMRGRLGKSACCTHSVANIVCACNVWCAPVTLQHAFLLVLQAVRGLKFS